MSQFAYQPTKSSPKQRINQDSFHDYSKLHMYRTSQGVHWQSKEPVPPRNVCVPGYQGFIPSKNANSDYGKSFSKSTRDNFANKNLGVNTFNLSSTGFNLKKYDFIDTTKSGFNHKYGTQTLLKPHPSQQEQLPQISHEKGSYLDPFRQTAPTFRETQTQLVNKSEKVQVSAYLSNYQQCDGNGWKPVKVLEGNTTQTNYRLEMNREKPFQRNPVFFAERKLKSLKNKQYY